MRQDATELEQQFRAAQERHFAGDVHAALSIYRGLLRRLPRNGPLLHALGAAEMAIGELASAHERLTAAIRLLPRDPVVRIDLGSVLRKQGRFIEARRAIEEALAIAPGNPTAIAQLAETDLLLGQPAEAERRLRGSLGSLDAAPDHPAISLAFARLASRIGGEREAIERLRRTLGLDAIAPILRCEALFRVAALHDRLGEVDAAFAALREANAMKPCRFDPSEFSRQVDLAITSWSPARLAALKRIGSEGRRAVFIVGMPRSGTTLVEQILDSHPHAAGGGELRAIGDLAARIDLGGSPPLVADPSWIDESSLPGMTREYLERLRRIDSAAEVVTDKMPLNGLNLGLVWRMLPEARVVVCRRSPLDTCLSCYFHHFSGALDFAYDLGHLGAMHRAHDRMLDHWIKVLPLRILEVRYESLVADPEPEIRRLLAHVGLAFDERCLRFHESGRVALTASHDQVRQPIYRSSVDRSERYRPHLGELRRALGSG